MKTKTKAYLGIASLGVIALVIALAPSKSFSNGIRGSFANECDHVGNHYLEKNKTCTKPGNKEFWACCKCQKQFDEYHKGIWKDCGQFTGTLEEGHVAYIPSSHNYGEYVARTDYIGKTFKTCSDCGDTVQGELMLDDDIKLDLTNAFGMNAKGLSNDKSEGSTKAGSPYWNTNLKETENISVKLPKVDYSQYDNVIFSFESSSKAYGYIGFNFNNEELLPFVNHGDDAKVFIKIIHNNLNNQYLDIKLSCSDGFVKTISSINNSNIYNGVSNLELTAQLNMYRIVYLKDVFVNHITHSTDIERISTSSIGHYDSYCGCGEPIGKGETLMTTSEINLKNTYGAGIVLPDSHGDTGFQVDGERLVWHGNNNDVTSLNLPRVEISAYKEVKFDLYYGCLWGRIGFTSEQTLGGYGDGYNPKDRPNKDLYRLPLTIIKLADGSYKATLACPEKGVSLQTTITDVDVLSGAKPLGLYCGMGGYTQICLDGVEVSEDYIHEHVHENVARDSIGIIDVLDCPLCGKEHDDGKTRIATTEDIDFMGNNGYGLYHELLTNQTNYFEIGGNFLTSDLLLPKVNYSLYDEVIFDFRLVTLWGQLGYRDATIGNIGDGKTGGDICYVVISKVSEDSYKFKIIDVDKNKKAETSLTDADIISGTKQLNMKCELGAYTAIRISGVSVSVNGHNHIPIVVPDTKAIGYKKLTCPICDEVLGDSNEIMTTSDINLGNGYGISHEAITKNNDNTYTFSGSNNTNTDLTIPKVNYSLFSEVKFTFKQLCLWGRIGYDVNHTIGGFGDGDVTSGEEILATITKQSDGSYKFVISDENRSESSECVLSDNDVLSGKESLIMYLQLGAYASLILTSVNVTVA